MCAACERERAREISIEEVTTQRREGWRDLIKIPNVAVIPHVGAERERVKEMIAGQETL